MNKRGFTLIELIMVIVILGILAAVALPKFYDLTEKAEIAAEAGVFGGVKAALAVYYANGLANGASGTDLWPVDLEDIDGPAAQATDDFFVGIMRDSVKAADDWDEDAANSYIGPTGDAYTYSDTTGTFTKD